MPEPRFITVEVTRTLVTRTVRSFQLDQSETIADGKARALEHFKCFSHALQDRVRDDWTLKRVGAVTTATGALHSPRNDA